VYLSKEYPGPSPCFSPNTRTQPVSSENPLQLCRACCARVTAIVRCIIHQSKSQLNVICVTVPCGQTQSASSDLACISVLCREPSSSSHHVWLLVGVAHQGDSVVVSYSIQQQRHELSITYQKTTPCRQKVGPRVRERFRWWVIERLVPVWPVRTIVDPSPLTRQLRHDRRLLRPHQLCITSIRPSHSRRYPTTVGPCRILYPSTATPANLGRLTGHRAGCSLTVRRSGANPIRNLAEHTQTPTWRRLTCLSRSTRPS
jgi:hypothetical protein